MSGRRLNPDSGPTTFDFNATGKLLAQEAEAGAT